MTDLAKKKCIPCEAGVPAFTRGEAKKFLAQLQGWKLAASGKKISKTFLFKGFSAPVAFAVQIAELADREGHHPDLHLSYGKCVVELSTHAIHGLSENDFILAAKIDALPPANKIK